MHTWYLVSMWFHILAAAFWIGGSLFLALVLIPGLRASSLRDRMAELVTGIAQRFSWAAWTGFGLLVTTGVFNLIYRGMTVEGVSSGEFWRSWYGEVLAWKLILVLLILSLSGVHVFWDRGPPTCGRRIPTPGWRCDFAWWPAGSGERTCCWASSWWHWGSF